MGCCSSSLIFYKSEKNPKHIEISGFQKEKVFINILHYYKSKGSKVYCRINCYFFMFCYIENTHLTTIWDYIHHEVVMRIIKTYCDIFREEAKRIEKRICSWELSLSANGILGNTIETLKKSCNPALQLYLFEHIFQW